MPWTLLGLDPAAATERDVKRAYAKRLKDCRPDQDPEGFRQLHDAYQAALNELKWRSAGDDDDDEYFAVIEPSGELLQTTTGDDAAVREEERESPEPPPVVFELSPGMRAITECFDRLEEALASGTADVPELVKQAETLLYEHPDEVIRWGELMQQAIARHGDHPGLVLTADTIVFELEHGGNAATVAVIERLDRKGNSEGVANLANLMLQNKARIATTAAGIAAVQLAGAAAFWARGRTERLADFAYQHLARGDRDFHMRLIDRHVEMASLLALVPVHLKSFWRQRLLRPGLRNDWDDEQSKQAIAWMKTAMARRGLAFEVLVGLLPEKIAAPIKAVAAHRQEPTWEKAEPGQKAAKWERRSSPGHTSGPPAWTWVFFAIFVLKMMMTCSNNMTSGPEPAPKLNPFPSGSLDQYDPETRRKINEGAEKFREFREKRDRYQQGFPEVPSAVPPVDLDLKPKQEPSENPLLQEFKSGTR